MTETAATSRVVPHPAPLVFETLLPAARTCIGGRGLYTAALCRLGTGELLACAHQGSPDLQQIGVWRSADSGRSWNAVRTRGAELFGRGAHLQCLRDGKTVLLHTGALYRSTDCGRRWQRLPCPATGAVRSIPETESGELILLGSEPSWYAGCQPPPASLLGPRYAWYREGSWGNVVGCLSWRCRSADGGRTWSAPEPIRQEQVCIERDTDWERTQPLFREASVLRLADGRLLAATRRSDPERTVLIDSADEGRTWSEPRPLPAPGAIHAQLLLLRDGRFLCTYARQTAPDGIFAVTSSDAGRTWDMLHPLQLATTLPVFHGWPSSVELEDGSLVTVYTMKGYEETTQNGDSLAAAVRWELPTSSAPAVVTPVPGRFFPEEHIYEMYCNGITGYTGRSMQHVAAWTPVEAERAQIPGYKGVVCRFPDGELLACPTPSRDGGHVSMLYRSTDAGRTWRHVPTEPEFLPGKEQAMLCLRDGRTVLLQTEAEGTPLFRSRDRGRTWNRVDYGTPTRTTRNLLELSNGTVVMFGSQGNWHAGAGAPQTVAWRLRSGDAGLHWTRDEVTTWEDPAPFFTEAFFLAFSDTRILAATRVNGAFARRCAGAPPIELGRGDETDEGMVLMESEDGGLHWTTPRWMGLGYSAVHAHLLRLRDGRILCVYRRRFLPFGVAGVFSSDNGRTWDHEHPILLGTRPTAYGGWPTSIQLPDDTMLTTRGFMNWPDATFEIVRWQLPLP